MKARAIRKLAIANRGEVAVRVIRACQELGIQTVLLHSEADRNSIAYRMSDEPVCVGPSPTAESYLHIERNIAAAKKAGADAIHPGFGFLSENPEFAQAVVDAGMIFVGPRAETIRQLGDKIEAKRLIEKAKVPTVPGYMGEDQSLPTLLKEAEKIGFPVMVKAAAGGGGRGLKVIRSAKEAPALIEAAQREGQSAFGSKRVFLEKYLDRAKHIEFQIFGDYQGNAVHLFERECSVQRRHQKIVEEALSPSLTEDLRNTIGVAAVQLAKAASYEGAGTVEFLVQDGQYYFLEMNTRLQVEHPVTEMVLGVDLVKAQILNAQETFEIWKQEELVPRGHAIECRLYAEDPYQNGIPSTGPLGACHWPWGPGRRFEVGFEAGDEITSYYDSMLAKVICWDEDRARAIEKTLNVLREVMVFGVQLNIPYLEAILSHPDFASGKYTTQFINQHFPEGLEPRPLTEEEKYFAQQAYRMTSSAPQRTSGSPGSVWESPWLRQWSNV